MRRFFKYLFILILILFVAAFFLSFKSAPSSVTYGISFSKFHSDELGLPWKDVLESLLTELNIKHFRLSAHWPMVEPEQGKYDFSVLDEQVALLRDHDADAVLAVGKRLPGWPECHVPGWAEEISKTDKAKYDAELKEYITAVVNRYKDSSTISMWQVENEPFLSIFAVQTCEQLDPEQLASEVALIKQLDPTRDVLVTDSGELGKWYQAAQVGDRFGTSVYLFVWNHFLGPMRYPIGPWYFRIKQNLVSLIYKHPVIAIEVEAEPWLLTPIKDAPIETQLRQMNIDRFKEMADFTKKSGFSTQYLWGGEWWYWMRQHGHPEFYDFAKTLYGGANN